MNTIVYHGTRISNLKKLASGIGGFPGLYVTDSADKAGRYANAQATKVVSTAYGPVAEHAAIVTMETDEAVNWLRRPNDHSSLDICETTIKTWRIVAVEAAECDYWNCSCHKDVAAIRASIQVEA